MGVFNTVGVLPAYLAILQFGVFSGLSRNLPLARGEGRLERGQELIETSGAAARNIGFLGMAICVLMAVWQGYHGGGKLLVWALIATGVGVFITPVTTHIDTTLRGLLAFRSLGWVLILSNIFAAASSGFIAGLGAVGGVVRVTFYALATLLVRLPLKVWRWDWKMNWPTTIELGRVGIPLLLSGTFFSFLMVSDRSIVALLMTKEDVGHFALAGMLVNSLASVPQSLSMMLFPRMARHYGKHRSSRALRKYLILNLIFNLVTIIPLSLFCLWGIEPLVRHFFPAYVPGIPAAKIACWTGLCWIYLGVGSVIGIVNRMTPYLIAMGVALVTIWGLGAYLIHTGHGIVGAAWARFAGTLMLCLFTIGYSWYLTTVEVNPSKERGL
jgi:O-antigen/teichoic acid export membrane protein